MASDCTVAIDNGYGLSIKCIKMKSLIKLIVGYLKTSGVITMN